MNKIKSKEIEKIEKERRNFIFSVIGIETVDFSGKHNKIEFHEPIKNKDGTISLYNPITLLTLKRKLVGGLNEKLENPIKGIVKFKIRIVGTGEEKWIQKLEVE